MPIDFPPPPTPVQGDSARLKADAARGEVLVMVGGYPLHVHAPGIFDAVEIVAITAGLSDLSAAIRALAAAAQRKGVLAPRTLYVNSGDDVYVSLVKGTLGTVSVPKPLDRYFEDLPRGKPLTVNAFERRRLLASLHANRLGESFATTFAPAKGNAYELKLSRGAETLSPGSVRVNLSNAGNRFTGREFVDLDARRGTRAGDEFSVFARTAARVLQLDEVEPGSNYHEAQLAWSRITPLGLFGASGRYLDYRQKLAPPQGQRLTFNGELWVADLGYTGIALSTATQRITLQAKGDYISKSLEFDQNGQKLQKEPYASLDVGAAWSTSFRLLSENWLSVAGLSARKGLGKGARARTLADLGYALVRPSYSLRSQGRGLAGEFQFAAQYADVIVPEQQQWIVGGIGNLHAYVPGVAIGDRGLLARLVGEYRAVDLAFVSVKPRLFVEFAAAEFAKPVGGVQSAELQSLADAGGELVFGVGPFFEAAITAAVPVASSGVPKQLRDEARSDLFFRFTAKF